MLAQKDVVKILMNENIPLFDSMVKQLDAYPEQRDVIGQILYQGQRIPFSPDTKSINMGIMFGFMKEKDNQTIVANRIFETRILNMLIVEEAIRSEVYMRGQSDKS